MMLKVPDLANQLRPPPDWRHHHGICQAGKIRKLVGLTLESDGPLASIGDLMRIQRQDGHACLAEVVGFRDEALLLMPLDPTDGIRPGATVRRDPQGLVLRVCEELQGRILDGLGRPLDGQPLPDHASPWSVNREAPPAMQRGRISEPFFTGVRSLDSALLSGRGQRQGIFAGSGVGKSTLLGMIARNAEADLNVIALIGERGKEVREFIEDTLGPEGMARSIVVVGTSDVPALQRVRGAETATAIAEYFRHRGANVMLIMDSLTRYAMAQREIGLAVGEPPTTRGYPPSAFARLPSLLERAGNDAHGSMTAFYTVLVEGDDLSDPIADAARSLLDGHIVLDRRLVNEGHYPPVDILQSVSRVMNQVAEPAHRQLGEQLRELVAQQRKARELVEFGVYQAGKSADLDNALARLDGVKSLLRQAMDEVSDWPDTWQRLQQAVAG